MKRITDRNWSLTISLVSLAMAGIPLGSLPAHGDCGSIPYYSPLKGIGNIFIESLPDGSANVEFDPLKVVVYEPGQRAIILWNGNEEILLLSTELRTSQPVSILEVIPLPAEPRVELGEFETFEKMMTLLIEKQMWKVASGAGVRDARLRKQVAEITFHKKMGAHDVTVVNVHRPAQFVDWVEAFLKKKSAVNAAVKPEFVEIIENYLDRGFTWFVFDAIEASDSVQSRQPIEYRFKTDSVFYPLEISTLEAGETLVDLLIVTKNELTRYPELRLAAHREEGVEVTRGELAGVSSSWAKFMRAESCTMQRVRIEGDIQQMKEDFVAR